ncbi:hypothetical protein PENTCL1PPCAC_30814, partial [Pristionchus entomophagus]
SRSLSPSPLSMREIKVDTPSRGYEDDVDPLYGSTESSSSMMRMSGIRDPFESSLFPFIDSPFLPQLDPSYSMDYTWDGLADEMEERLEYTQSKASPQRCLPAILQQQHRVAAAAAVDSSSFAAATTRLPLTDDLQLLQSRKRSRPGEGGGRRKSGGQEAKRICLGVSSNLDSLVAQTITEDVKSDLSQLHASMAAASFSSVGSAAAAAARTENSFRVPKQPLKMYSRRWWQVCAGIHAGGAHYHLSSPRLPSSIRSGYVPRQ